MKHLRGSLSTDFDDAMYTSQRTFGPSIEDIANLHIWAWAKESTLFEDFARIICGEDRRFWWTHLVLSYSFAWNLYMSVEGQPGLGPGLRTKVIFVCELTISFFALRYPTSDSPSVDVFSVRSDLAGFVHSEPLSPCNSLKYGIFKGENLEVGRIERANDHSSCLPRESDCSSECRRHVVVLACIVHGTSAPLLSMSAPSANATFCKAYRRRFNHRSVPQLQAVNDYDWGGWYRNANSSYRCGTPDRRSGGGHQRQSSDWCVGV